MIEICHLNIIKNRIKSSKLMIFYCKIMKKITFIQSVSSFSLLQFMFVSIIDKSRCWFIFNPLIMHWQLVVLLPTVDCVLPGNAPSHYPAVRPQLIQVPLQLTTTCYETLATMYFDKAGCYLELHLTEKFISKNVMIINATFDALSDYYMYLSKRKWTTTTVYTT